MAARSGWQPHTPPDDDWEPVPGAVGRGEEDSAGPSVPLGRQRALVIFFGLVLVALTARVLSWTLPAAAQNARPTAVPETRRGRIVDRNGLLMATDTYVGEVYASPKTMAETQQQKRLATAVISASLALNQPIDALRATWPVTATSAVITRQATVQQCDTINREIRSRDFVWCDYIAKREYPQGDVAAHALGFLNRDHIGLYGLEARYDDWLGRGQGGGTLPRATMTPPEGWNLYLPSPSGRDVVLNLDVPLQYVVERRLQEAVQHYQAEAGTIIIMDPRTGAVLAMANYPTFDPGDYSAAASGTWVNPAISEIYEPGSVFKLVTVAAGLDSGYITADSTFMDSGSLPIGGRVIRNAEFKSYGSVTVRDALARSINVVSAQVSLRMGSETFYKYVRQFGFGHISEVDLASEVAGIVKQPGKGTGWSEYDLAANSFGQGISVTAFQMINAIAAIANGGLLLQPQMARAMVEDGVVHPLPPRVLGRAIKPDAAHAMAEMMVYTVEQSSNTNPVPGYRVAGKTGTAEIPTKEGYISTEGVHSFIGFLPAADPQLIIMVKLVKPKVGLWAEQTAIPTFAQVGQEAVQILGIKPDNRKP